MQQSDFYFGQPSSSLLANDDALIFDWELQQDFILPSRSSSSGSSGSSGSGCDSSISTAPTPTPSSPLSDDTHHPLSPPVLVPDMIPGIAIPATPLYDDKLNWLNTVQDPQQPNEHDRKPRPWDLLNEDEFDHDGNKRKRNSSTGSKYMAPDQQMKKVAHNAIERRYRTNLNDRIQALRSVVPSLQEAETTEADEKKLNKATILRCATEYILDLKHANAICSQENEHLQQLIASQPGGELILAQFLTQKQQYQALEAARMAQERQAQQERERMERKRILKERAAQRAALARLFMPNSEPKRRRSSRRKRNSSKNDSEDIQSSRALMALFGLCLTHPLTQTSESVDLSLAFDWWRWLRIALILGGLAYFMVWPLYSSAFSDKSTRAQDHDHQRQYTHPNTRSSTSSSEDESDTDYACQYSRPPLTLSPQQRPNGLTSPLIPPAATSQQVAHYLAELELLQCHFKQVVLNGNKHADQANQPANELPKASTPFLQYWVDLAAWLHHRDASNPLPAVCPGLRRSWPQYFAAMEQSIVMDQWPTVPERPLLILSLLAVQLQKTTPEACTHLFDVAFNHGLLTKQDIDQIKASCQ